MNQLMTKEDLNEFLEKEFPLVGKQCHLLSLFF